MDRMMTVEEVAELLAINGSTVRRWAERGELPGVRLGKLWRFQPARIEELLTSAPRREPAGA